MTGARARYAPGVFAVPCSRAESTASAACGDEREVQHQLARDRVGVAADGVDHDVRLAVERLAFGEDRAQVVERAVVVGHGPGVALRDDARPVVLRPGA